jgi:hypothetical protein
MAGVQKINIGPMGIRIVVRDFEVQVIVAKSLTKLENLELVAWEFGCFPCS